MALEKAENIGSLPLKEELTQQIPILRQERAALVKEYGSKVVSEVTLAQAFGGMRGVTGLICDTSDVDPDRGLIVRGTPMGQLTDKLPEEIFYYLCTGKLPDKTALASLQEDLKRRAEVPSYVWSVLKAMPPDSHPMAMFNTGILVMQKESLFAKRYAEGMAKDDYWKPCLEDCLTLIARLPALAAGIYRMCFNKGGIIPSNPSLDWAGDYAHMLGIPDPSGEFANLMRLYMTLHSDHEGGNVSAFSAHTIGSALSDIYYSVSGGLNGLAGPLHGLANQECLKFVLEVKERFAGVPSLEELRKFSWDTLNSGKVIPGYGHAVLRVTDPRFTAFHAFGKRVCPDDPVFQIVDRIFDVVPKVLVEQGKAKDPWPNVDAISGSLLYHFGMTEFSYYTVLFSVSRTLGISAQMIINRALGSPIVRPKSIPTATIKKLVASK